MSLFSVLCGLYDENVSIAGVIDGEKTILIPVYHTTVAAQITVTLNGDGQFLGAETVPNDENEKRTLIPVTDKSASRTAGIEPHPLCDNLKYLAGDYNRYVNGKDCTKNYQLYMEGLREWAESRFCHPKVLAIYTYLSKGRLVADLVQADVLETDENKTPAVSTAKVHRSVIVSPLTDRPKSFSDYEILYEDPGCVKPEVYDFV